MPDYVVHKASALARDERLLVERLLGRTLSNDETISVNAYRPLITPGGVDREALRLQIVAQALDIGSRAPDVTTEEIESMLDEAFAETRGSRS